MPVGFNFIFSPLKLDWPTDYYSRLSSRMTYALLKTRTNYQYGIFNITYQRAKNWNDIHVHVCDNVKLLSLKQFKKKFKSSIIASY